MISRSFIIRISSILAILALSVFLFIVGKGHTIYLDTNRVTIDGVEYRAYETTAVTVNKLPTEEMGRAERALVQVGGPNHRIRLESLSGDGKIMERSIRIPIWWDEVVVSIPAIIAGASDTAVLSLFVEPPRVDEPVQKTIQQEESDVIQLEPVTAP